MFSHIQCCHKYVVNVLLMLKSHIENFCFGFIVENTVSLRHIKYNCIKIFVMFIMIMVVMFWSVQYFLAILV